MDKLKRYKITSSCLILVFIMGITIFVSCTQNENTPPEYSDISIDSTIAPSIPEIPDLFKQLLKPEIVDLLGKSRSEIRPGYRIETSERDTSFWYSGLGWLEDGTEGNVYISYNIDGMTYNGLCDFISGEINHITHFPKGTTFTDLEQQLGLENKDNAMDGFVYILKDWEIYADRDLEDNETIGRITVKTTAQQ